MINTGSSALRKEATRKVRDAAMLLLMRRLPTDDETFCAFRKDSRADDSREQATDTIDRSARTEHVREKTEQQIAKLVLICASRLWENLWDDGSYTEVFLDLLHR